MLKNISKNSSQTSSLSVEQLLPDPWETSSLTVKPQSLPDSWQIPSKTHSLTTPLAIPEVRKLPPAFNTIKVLLQDELKLTDSKLRTKMEQALALLCWIETLTYSRP